jgi:hypothetical protein
MPALAWQAAQRMGGPLHLSHAVSHLTSVAVDHLHALRALVVDAQALHNSAPYTLARSAIEAGATALWLLHPPQRDVRVVRRMRHAAQDTRDLLVPRAAIKIASRHTSCIDGMDPPQSASAKAGCGSRAPGSGAV